MSTFRWGILGTGNIAGAFANGLRALDDAALVAVGSRTAEAANAFGDRFGVPRRHASYEALAHDPEVDAIYVATPHPFHKANTLLCLHAGKPVLCEKPFAINAAEAAQMIAAARERGVFLMEAMWTRFLPHVARLRELLAAGAIGEVRQLRADFSFRTEFNPRGRLVRDPHELAPRGAHSGDGWEYPAARRLVAPVVAHARAARPARRAD
jgi:predicted dehydrogenase